MDLWSNIVLLWQPPWISDRQRKHIYRTFQSSFPSNGFGFFQWELFENFHRFLHLYIKHVVKCHLSAMAAIFDFWLKQKMIINGFNQIRISEKKNNHFPFWVYAKTWWIGGGHIGFPIDKKYTFERAIKGAYLPCHVWFLRWEWESITTLLNL
jgi:hypothetical protein